jgi:hypothetical protein
MFAKFLKRYHSRTGLNDNSIEITEEEKSAQSSSVNVGVDSKIEKNKSSQESLPLQYRYQVS